MSHERLATTFDQWAADGRDASMEREHGDVVGQVLAQLEIRPGEQILDLGCGNGWATRLLAKAAAGASAIGVDVSPGMIERAEALHSLTIRARYEVAKFEALGLADRKFDRVFSMEALYYAVDLDRALAECFRVLKPGGRADVVVDFYAESPHTAEWRDKTGVPMHYLSTAQWCDAFARAGFTDITTRRVFDSRDVREAAHLVPDECTTSWEKKLAIREAGSLWIRGMRGAR
jgi:ubiquinone/menaquinone biosynthesis C-methylase UbiE